MLSSLPAVQRGLSWQPNRHPAYAPAWHLLHYCLLLNIFISVSTSAYLTWFSDGKCQVVVRHTCNCGTPLSSLGDCITSSLFLWISIVFAFAFVLKCCVYCIAQPPRHITLLCCCWLLSHLCAWFTYSSLNSQTLHKLLAHHYLCYIVNYWYMCMIKQLNTCVSWYMLLNWNVVGLFRSFLPWCPFICYFWLWGVYCLLSKFLFASDVLRNVSHFLYFPVFFLCCACLKM